LIRIMIVLSILGIIGWSGFWVYSREIRIDWVESVLDSAAGTNWSVSHETIRARGYPFRVDITISDLTIRNDERGVAWHLPTVQLLMLSYRIDHVIIAFPKTQDVTLAGGHFQLQSENMKASLTTDGVGGILRAVIVEADRLGLVQKAEHIETVENLLLAVQHEHSTPGQYRVSLASTRDDAPAAAAIPPLRANLLARLLAQMTLDGRITVSQPLGPNACTEGGITLQNVTLEKLSVSEQNVDIDLSSDVRFSPTGMAEGWIDVHVSSLRSVLELLETLGYRLGELPRLITTLDGGVGFRVNLVGGAVEIFGFKLFDARPVQPLC